MKAASSTRFYAVLQVNADCLNATTEYTSADE